MKKTMVLTLSTALLLGACGNNDDEKKEDKEVKTEEKATTEKPTTEKATTEKPTTEKATTEEITTEEVTTEQQTTESVTTEQAAAAPVTTEAPAVNFNNVTDRATLESIVYGNYSEIDKVTAYKSAVANGVIPQGNVMEGPASKAYESSLRVESGAEKSIYDGAPQTEEDYSDPYETTDMYQARADLDTQYQNGEITKEQYDQWVAEMDQLIQSQGNQ
ncbi:hypothetical protein ERX27_07655 [Macrococcus brunensis]|uniref:SHOCT domain-containing protein n=1 Tax=Macrococcus brunensis TaxID=198483 RepID=A0A4R6BD01_9STAP|nr:hypothetical protein [Macrococcus brunensis]TDL96721.1 hypothetical protein ERX27_07655 [Macrococcus brunensis]